jgi:glycosyltransferase involved in cell wall biosynthesis
MKLAFVVPRYGADLSGGREHQCRLIAERLAGTHHVEVLTTCASDSRTWANVHAEGADRLRGVTVRRFAAAHPGDPAAVRRASDRIFFGRHTPQDELEYLRQQGPWAPALVEHLERQHAQYDVLIFFTSLHAPAVLGARVAPYKSILIPAVQDGPELQLGVFRELFSSAAGFAWETDDERRLVSSRFHLRSLVDDVVGCGVDLPEGEVSVDGGDWRLVGPPDREPLPPHLEGAANAFRRRHRLYGPFVLQAGRIEPGEGCEELLEYYQHYLRDGGDARLVLMGTKLMPLPEDPGLRFGGTLPDEERAHSLEAATVVVLPSPDDRQLMLALEALSVGTPVLVNARSTTVVQHCRRSQAGLFYADRWEFSEALKLLTHDARLRSALGRNGRTYVSRHYRWPTVLSKYERLCEQLRGSVRNGRTESPEPDRTRAVVKPREPEGDRRDRGRGRFRERDRGRHDRSRHRRRERR